MVNEPERIRWAPKVAPALIERVYRDDAAGLCDEALIDDLGIRLLLRCEAVLRAMRGDVQCPRCGREFNFDGQAAKSVDGVAPCPAGCGWSVTRQDYRTNKRHRELNGADTIIRIFDSFVAEYPNCRTARDKLLRIDRLIHDFHWDARSSLPNRSVSNNLIEGNHKQVIEFLANLSAVDPERKQRWRATVDRMWKRRRGELKAGPPERIAGESRRMNILIRELGFDELGSLAELDASVSNDAVYDVVAGESGTSLALQKRRLDPPADRPTWGANETASRLRLWRENYHQGCKFWGAFAGGRLVGFCLLSSEMIGNALQIYSIFVDRASRGKGIGSRLIAEAEGHCRSIGVKAIYLTTTLSNVKAIAFYRKIGYRIVGIHDRACKDADGQVAFCKEL